MKFFFLAIRIKKFWALDVFLSWLVIECYTTYMPNFDFMFSTIKDAYLMGIYKESTNVL